MEVLNNLSAVHGSLVGTVKRAGSAFHAARCYVRSVDLIKRFGEFLTGFQKVRYDDVVDAED